jgi:predicted lipoprotein with Yx(FWY)xxD motif
VARSAKPLVAARRIPWAAVEDETGPVAKSETGNRPIRDPAAEEPSMNVSFTARRVAGGAVVALAALVLVAACSASAAPAGAGGYGATPASAPPATAAPTAAQSGAATVAVNAAQDATLGPILVDGNGMTLYLYKPDSPNQSVCTGGCAQAWPPLIAKSGETATAGAGVTGSLTTFARADGSMQVAYNGTPLYYYIKDTKAGDTTGQGVGGIWFVLKP